MKPPFKGTTKIGRAIDSGIEHEVRVLWENGVETFESCQGGEGHPFPEPTVRFLGGQAEGPRAFGIARRNGLNVAELRRYWSVIDGELTGPYWEMTFRHPKGSGGRLVRGTWRWR
jgi:hypothetical protein